MPEETRYVIEAFSALAHDQATVTARLDSRGVLTLASVQAAKTVALANTRPQTTRTMYLFCSTNVVLPQGLNVSSVD